jgi:hypothetical protein
MKCHSTDARMILAYPRETWLRDQRHSTFTKLIRRASPNHQHHRDSRDNSGGNIAAARIDCHRKSQMEKSNPARLRRRTARKTPPPMKPRQAVMNRT